MKLTNNAKYINAIQEQKMAALVQASRFALLNVDSSSDDDGKTKKQAKNSKSGASKSAKRKKNKKKQNTDAADVNITYCVFLQIKRNIFSFFMRHTIGKFNIGKSFV